MKRRDEKAFTKLFNEVLIAHGMHFQGIRLRCRRCGEIAFAVSPLVAEIFGWSQLAKAEGPEYTGLCIECGDPPRADAKPNSK